MIDWEQELQGLEGFEAYIVTHSRGAVIDGGHTKSVKCSAKHSMWEPVDGRPRGSVMEVCEGDCIASWAVSVGVLWE